MSPQFHFPFDAEFDFLQRPNTYWPEAPTEQTEVSRIAGTARRALAEHPLEEPADLPLPPVDFLFADTLSGEEREAWGQLHPSFMGGEYLPEAEGGEAVIATIDLDSVTADVIQVRARPRADGIHYRVVDEYDNRWHLTPSESAEPLSLGELIDLIDTARKTEDSVYRFDDDRYDVGLFDGILNADYDHGGELEETRYFVTVGSGFYLMLTEYYEKRSLAWYERAKTDAVTRARRAENGVDVSPQEGLSAILDSAVLESRIKRIFFPPLIRLAYGIGFIQGVAEALIRRCSHRLRRRTA